MGVVRVFGLVFFMTILIGGCVVAVNSPSPPGAPGDGYQVTWDEAVGMLQQGQVIGLTQTLDLRVYMYLRDGTRVLTVAPSQTSVPEALFSCGETCGGLSSGNV
jgi:hypothetical protein